MDRKAIQRTTSPSSFGEQPHPIPQLVRDRLSPLREECNFTRVSSDRRRNEEEVDLKNPLTTQRTREKKTFIQYNRAYIDYARENRKKSTKAENIFWHIVKDRKFLGYKFRRQKCIGPFILDFYCSELLLGIELDGGYHNDTIDYDRHRDAEIYKKGILIIRFRNKDIENNLEGVISELEKIIKIKKIPSLLVIRF